MELEKNLIEIFQIDCILPKFSCLILELTQLLHRNRKGNWLKIAQFLLHCLLLWPTLLSRVVDENRVWAMALVSKGRQFVAVVLSRKSVTVK